MAIDYKVAYKDQAKQYRALLARNMELADYRRVMEWMYDKDRKPANTAFTEGPERQLAYTVEWLINTLEKPDLSGQTEYLRPPMLLKATEKCPRCGYARLVFRD